MPLSSVAVPVMVKVVEARMLPLGPVTLVVGVWSSVLKDSIFLVALVESPVPPVGAVNAWAMTRRLRLVAMVAGIDHVRVVPVPGARVALRKLLVPLKVVLKAVPLSVRYWLLSRSWIWTCTRPTVPLATRAVPVIWNGVLLATTRPSIGVVIVVSGAGAGN